MIPLTCDQRINVSENKSNPSLNQSFPGELLRLILFLKVGLYSSNYCPLLHPRKSEILEAFGTGGLWGVGRGVVQCVTDSTGTDQAHGEEILLLQILFGLNIEQRRARCFQRGPVKRWIKSLFLFQSLVSHYVWVGLLPFFYWIFKVVHKHELNYSWTLYFQLIFKTFVKLLCI